MRSKRSGTIRFTFQYVSINTLKILPFFSGFVKFTFQYVSINTAELPGSFITFYVFTFQYVSINTSTRTDIKIRYFYLHSNMFLLILSSLNLHSRMFSFTFQYVSINTERQIKLHRQIRSIYIPICFY